MAYVTALATMPSNIKWKLVIWDQTNKLFLAFPVQSSAYYTSPDGVSWTARTLPFASSISVFGAIATPSFICVVTSNTPSDGVPGTYRWCFTSTDGINWSAETAFPNQGQWYSGSFRLVYNGSVVAFTSVTDNGASHLVAISSDGLSWTRYATAAPSTRPDMCWDGVYFITILSTGNKSSKSTDAISWVDGGSYGLTASSIAWSGSILCVIGAGTRTTSTSTDHGVTWNDHINALPAASTWQRVMWDGSNFIAIASDAPAAYSADGAVWYAIDANTYNLGWMAFNGSITLAVPNQAITTTIGELIGQTLAPPTALPATNITTSGFTANWI